MKLFDQFRAELELADQRQPAQDLLPFAYLRFKLGLAYVVGSSGSTDHEHPTSRQGCTITRDSRYYNGKDYYIITTIYNGAWSEQHIYPASSEELGHIHALVYKMDRAIQEYEAYLIRRIVDDVNF